MQTDLNIKRRFVIGTTVNGFEVVDAETGRPMRTGYETSQQANGGAKRLNDAAAAGPKALARALKATDR
jgi:hypothetical protein